MLPDLDLDRPGRARRVALVGTTGAGKTTIAKLATRFYDPTDGPGAARRRRPARPRPTRPARAVVMVTQENFLFSGTVADNIRFGRPDADRGGGRGGGPGDRRPRLHQPRCPTATTPTCANRGGRLSAGQRQLVAFARAFLADPAVLILDEATSSLDVPSERLVQRALRTHARRTGPR